MREVHAPKGISGVPGPASHSLSFVALSQPGGGVQKPLEALLNSVTAGINERDQINVRLLENEEQEGNPGSCAADGALAQPSLGPEPRSLRGRYDLSLAPGCLPVSIYFTLSLPHALGVFVWFPSEPVFFLSQTPALKILLWLSEHILWSCLFSLDLVLSQQVFLIS